MVAQNMQRQESSLSIGMPELIRNEFLIYQNGSNSLSSFDNENSDNMEVLSAVQLNKIRFEEFQVLFRNLPLFFGCIIVPFYKSIYSIPCAQQTWPWLVVMSIIHLAYSLRSLIMVFYILRLKFRHKNLRPSINKWFFLTVTIFESAWLIYGNTFHYN
jgi:hypothetical protein